MFLSCPTWAHSYGNKKYCIVLYCILVSGFTCLLHRKQKLCPYLSNVFKQSKFVCSPVTGKVLCKWKFGTAKLYGYFKTVGIQVIPVLHST